ncbi:EthD family reductase [Agriterribacter humi]|jgi:uncharacterized protein (TIGR02118 family)|uniref:EthD family reductase n=1 Tax=Agriterribacter humi TaxID=1104781 RepID=UPI0012647145|nr:EthD family reductase [Agriterribacter humi]
MDNNSLKPIFCATVLYPNKEGATFDFELYANELIPEYVEILGDNVLKFEVRKGLTTPGQPAPNFICTANIWVSSGEKFGASMADPRMKSLMAKISAFTDIQPLRQFDQVIA